MIKTHFSTKAHWITPYWCYEMLPSFLVTLTSTRRFGEQTKVARYGCRCGKKSLVYSGVNPCPHPNINNPLSFVRKLKHHYIYEAVLPIENTQLLPFACTVSTTFAHSPHQWSFTLQAYMPAYYVIHMGLGQPPIPFTYHYWQHDTELRAGS